MEQALSHSKGMALVVYLASEGEPVPRERVAGLLWPDRPDARARNALSVTLSRLRDELGPDTIGGKGEDRLWVSADHLAADVIELRRASAEDDPRKVLELYRGPFLDGFSVKGAAAFSRWADRRREELRRTAHEAALALGTQGLEEGDLERAERAYRRARDLAPLKEKGTRGLIRVLARRGERTEALQLYESFRERLAEELDLSPSPKMDELADDVRSRRGDAARSSASDRGGGSADAPSRDSRRSLSVGASAAAIVLLGTLAAAVWWNGSRTGQNAGERTPLPDPERPTLAVMPFEDLGPDSTGGRFAAGLYEDLLTTLSKQTELWVVSGGAVPGSSADGTGGDDDGETVRRIGEELGAAAVLGGSVRRAGGDIRVTARLVDVGTGRQLWAESFDRALSVSSLLDIQRRIARQIAPELEAELLTPSGREQDSLPTTDLAAYDAYLKGKDYLASFFQTLARPQADSAAASFRAALRRDPEFALAHAGLGQAHAGRALLPKGRPGGSSYVDSAFARARQALLLRPRLAEAHLAEGLAYWVGDRASNSLRSAERAFLRAVDLNPSSAMAAVGLGTVYQNGGQPVDAVRWYRRAVRLNPRILRETEPILAQTLMIVGLHDPAIAWARRARSSKKRRSARAAYVVASVQHRRGDTARALRTVSEHLAERPGSVLLLGVAARFAVHGGDYRRARMYMDSIRSIRAGSARGRRSAPDSLLLHRRRQALLGYINLQLGNRERGRRQLETSRLRYRALIRTDVDPDYANPFPASNLARANAALGAGEEAVDALSLAVERGLVRDTLYDPLFDPVRDDPALRDLMQRMRRDWREARDRLREINLGLYPETETAAGGGNSDSGGG